MMSHIRVTMLFVLLFSIVLSGCERTPQQPPHQVILILLDAARPDRFSSYGYRRETTPAMDALAKNGVVFRQHYAQSTHTRGSVPSFLYSRYFTAPIFPNSQEVPFSHPSDLFRRPDDTNISFVKAFERVGFKTAAISAHNWTGQDTPFAMEFMETHDLARRHVGERGYVRAQEVIDYAIKWIRDHRREDF